MENRNYTELSKLKTFEERFRYLLIGGAIGEDTFGFDRYLNQMFYGSYEWREARREVLLRDNGCDLGVEGYMIYGRPLIHHINPISKRDILDRSEILLNPEYLITVSPDTHNAIHYGDLNYILEKDVITRSPNDTCPWKRATTFA